MSDPIHAKEQDFHDHWAQETAVEDVLVREPFEGPAALEARIFLRELGPLSGKRILDVGAGLGESSVYFALQGAEVTATDLSPAMAAMQQRLAARHGVKLTSHVGPAETLTGDGFDIVHTANLIHHLTDKRAFIQSAARMLRKDGVFVSWDPVRYNPIIWVYRRLATQVRTEDEAPLGVEDLRLLQEYFPVNTHRHTWIAAQLLFLKYFLFDRVGPNQTRYWKRIYQETDSSLRWWKPLEKADRVLTRIPLLKWLSWNLVFIGRAP